MVVVSPSSETAGSWRLAVADRQGINLTIVTFAIASNDTIEISVRDGAPEAVLGLVRRFAGSRAEVASTAEDSVDHVRELLATTFANEGYRVTELPKGDVELQFALDLENTTIVGQQRALHDLASSSDDLGRRVHASLVGAFARCAQNIEEPIRAPLSKGDHAGAAAALLAARDEGSLAFADNGVLDAALGIDVQVIAPSQAEAVRMCRIALVAKQRRYVDGEVDALALLKLDSGLSVEERASVETALGISYTQLDAREAAVAIWRRVATNAVHSVQDRAWAWRNLSLALAPQQVEAITAARASADAFLEAGQKRDAISSLLVLCDILGHHQSASMEAQLDSLLALSDGSGLTGQAERAALHHAVGRRYLNVRSHQRALVEAEAAVALWRGLYGVDDQMISSLHLAALAASALGEVNKASALKAEADALSQDTGSVHFQMSRRIAHLLSEFDPLRAREVVRDARAIGAPELWAAAELTLAINSPDLDNPMRLAALERLHSELKAVGARSGIEKPVRMALAKVLAEEGEFRRAASWLRRILDEDATALDARDMLVDTFRRGREWGQLATLLKTEVKLRGEMPGLLTILGEALLEAGDASGAVTTLTKALKLVPPGASRVYLETLRDRALDLGGTIQPPAPQPLTKSLVLGAEFERALADYVLFISGQKRMAFWIGTGGNRKWVSHPERLSQNLLHTFLKGRFEGRIEVFEELGAGAGRLDLLIRLEGGLQAVLELKMCGSGYTPFYAASGEVQLRHYMKARDVHLGYLVVHDARTGAARTPLLSPNGKDTIMEVLVDVSPTVVTRQTTPRPRASTISLRKPREA